MFIQLILNIFRHKTTKNNVKPSLNINEKRSKLKAKYKRLLEKAYNLRQTDSAMSDVFEFNAIQLLNELNQMKYLNRESNIKNIDL